MSTYRPDPSIENPGEYTPDPMLIQALAGLNADGEMRTAQTTRRKVACKIFFGRERNEKRRHSRALAIMASLGILVLLSPALWQSMENLIAEEHFGSFVTQVTLLILLLFTALIAALIASWRNGPEIRHGKRNS
ncbi:MAG TPA: hypothetical protein VM554_13990 [Acidisarcina sp.]|nr:hypothetical protein [Acidisarcina sp.]